MAFLLCCSIINLKGSAQRNPNNQFDLTGEQHNIVLDAFFTDQTRDIIGDNLTTTFLINYICKKFPAIDCNSVRQSLGSQLFSDTKGKSLLETEAILIERSIVSDRHSYYVQRINDILDQHFAEDYNVCYKEILTLEDEMANDSQLSQTDKSNLYYATSVARYSVKFWKDVSAGVLRYPSIVNEVGQLSCCSILSGIAKSDITGAIVGGVIGGPGGAVAGGAGSSVGAAVSHFWHSLFN